MPAPWLSQGLFSTADRNWAMASQQDESQSVPCEITYFYPEKIYNLEVNGLFSAIVSVAFIYPKGVRMKENVATHKQCRRELQQIHFQDRNSVPWGFSHVFTVSSDEKGSCQCWVKERFCLHPHRMRNTETFLFEHAQKSHINALTNIEMFLACKKLYPREIWVSIWTSNQIVIFILSQTTISDI